MAVTAHSTSDVTVFRWGLPFTGPLAPMAPPVVNPDSAETIALVMHPEGMLALLRIPPTWAGVPEGADFTDFDPFDPDSGLLITPLPNLPPAGYHITASGGVVHAIGAEGAYYRVGINSGAVEVMSDLPADTPALARLRQKPLRDAAGMVFTLSPTHYVRLSETGEPEVRSTPYVVDSMSNPAFIDGELVHALADSYGSDGANKVLFIEFVEPGPAEFLGAINSLVWGVGIS